MKILVLCEEGNKRSVVLGHQLKYLQHDVLTAALKRNKLDTLRLLIEWADLVILTDFQQIELMPSCPTAKGVTVWEIGPDCYPHNFHRGLIEKCRKLIQENPLD